MRGAGLPVEAIIEYVKLFMEGDETVPARLLLLQEQREALVEQQARIRKMMDKLDYKISHYEEAVKTGKPPVWTKNSTECAKKGNVKC